MIPIQKFFSSREETTLVLIGTMFVVIIGLFYLWGVGTLAESLRLAVGGAKVQPQEKIEFNVVGAEALLRSRGLLQ